jgi:hydroxymethylpyrimidine/phosphomethylpyrimidine kinase
LKRPSDGTAGQGADLRWIGFRRRGGHPGGHQVVTALGGFATTAVTALTAQNTLGVQGVMGVPAEFIRLQIRMVLEDLGADAVKTGMLADSATIGAVCDALAESGRGIPLVADPVMVARAATRCWHRSGGDAGGAAAADRRPHHAEHPGSRGAVRPRDPDVPAMHRAADRLLRMGVRAVLLKGGHGTGPVLTDLLATPDGTEAFESPRIATRHTHGTGCTLASAIACGLAQGMSLRDAVLRGRAYVRAAMEAAPGFGAGHGPLGHGVTMDPDRIGRLA